MTITTKLCDAPSGVVLRVLEIKTSPAASHRLLTLGLRVGDSIIKFGAALWGPVLVKNTAHPASKIAIGQGIARRILVGHDAP